MSEVFNPEIGNLMEGQQISSIQYSSIRIGQETPWGTVISKGSFIEHVLAESPLYACRSRLLVNCKKCVLADNGCGAALRK